MYDAAGAVFASSHNPRVDQSVLQSESGILCNTLLYNYGLYGGLVGCEITCVSIVQTPSLCMSTAAHQRPAVERIAPGFYSHVERRFNRFRPNLSISKLFVIQYSSN